MIYVVEYGKLTVKTGITIPAIITVRIAVTRLIDINVSEDSVEKGCSGPVDEDELEPAVDEEPPVDDDEDERGENPRGGVARAQGAPFAEHVSSRR
jgi:hypothetical protein